MQLIPACLLTRRTSLRVTVRRVGVSSCIATAFEPRDIVVGATARAVQTWCVLPCLLLDHLLLSTTQYMTRSNCMYAGCYALPWDGTDPGTDWDNRSHMRVSGSLPDMLSPRGTLRPLSE